MSESKEESGNKSGKSRKSQEKKIQEKKIQEKKIQEKKTSIPLPQFFPHAGFLHYHSFPLKQQ